MKKQLILMALFLCLFLTACGDKAAEGDEEGAAGTGRPVENDADAGEADEDSISNQIQLIADHVSLWQNDMETDLHGYAVTDLDNNGRLEIISSSCQGTGLYTYSDIREVNEAMDGLTLCIQEKEEGGSQADIMVQSVPVYYDSSSNIYYYIFDDLIKNGAAEYYENKRAVSLQDGQVLETFLAYKTTIYTDSDPTVTYTDADNRSISEEEYDGIADQIFSGLDKKQADIQWITNESARLKDMSDREIYAMLEESCNAFSVK